MTVTCLYDLFLPGGVVDPAIKGKDLSRLKKNAALVCRITIAAIDTFLKGSLSQFDALVGEQSCQFRACKIAELSKIPGFKGEATALKAQVDENSFPEQMLSVSEDMRFVILSFLLSQAKKMIRSEETFFGYVELSDPVRLNSYANGLELSKSQVTKIVIEAQVQLSRLSVSYVQRGGALPVAMLNGRACVPCFDGVDLLFKRMLVTQQKVLVEVFLGNSPKISCGKVKMLYGPNSANDGFEQLSLEREEPDTPVVVFAGVSLDEQHKQDTMEPEKRQFMALNLVEVILANAAQHRQYPKGVEIDAPPNSRRDGYAAKAKELGCVPNDMRLFLVDHVYATTMGEVIERL